MQNTSKKLEILDNAPVANSGPFSSLAEGKRVLQIEAEALHALAATLDEPFVKAIEVLLAVKGRVIITGMGKSGHIARKIAATMASTGTPSHFVHPGEASHGDLGMIAADDAVIAISNSGEAVELGDVIAHTRRYRIPLIAITGRAESNLATQADIALIMPNVPEACPLQLAPTTSTTMTLALGDALAVALYERKDFTSDNFRALHPGGKLGKKLLKVEDLMHVGAAMPVVREGTLMDSAILEISAKRMGCVGVLDDKGILVGVLTDGDMRRHMNSLLLQMKVEEIMNRAPKTIRAGALAAEAVGRMNELKITNLFVIADDKPVGIIHIHDCLKAGIA